jgi:hypothetical protein
LIESWKNHLADAEGPTPEAEEIATALYAMPDFQLSEGSADVTSPNIVTLAAADGGLFVRLRDASPWFDEASLTFFSKRAAEPKLGTAMALLEPEDLKNLRDALRDARIIGDTPEDKWAEDKRVRLLEMIERATKDPALTVALTEL